MYLYILMSNSLLHVVRTNRTAVGTWYNSRNGNEFHGTVGFRGRLSGVPRALSLCNDLTKLEFQNFSFYF